MKKSHYSGDVMELVKDDLEYGLSPAQVESYLNRADFSSRQKKLYSEALRDNFPKEVLEIAFARGLKVQQMQVACGYVRKGISEDALREVLSEERSAKEMSDMMQDILNRQEEDAAVPVTELSDSLQEQLDEVLQQKEHLEQQIAAALNAFIGQNYGAGKMDRVKKGYRASLWTVGVWGLLITLAFVLLPGPIAKIFFYEPEAIAIAVGYLVIIGFCEGFMCEELMTVGALSGLGRTRLCSVISITFTSARIPLAILLGGRMGLTGIWWAFSSTSIAKGIIFVLTFFYITRETKNSAVQ